MEKDYSEFRQKELENCSFIKTILILIIILYHSMLFWSGNWFVGEPKIHAPILDYCASFFSTFHTYAFTLVSGYIFAYLKYEKNKYQNFLPFVKNKAKRLLVPYLFACVCWVIPITIYFFNNQFIDIITKYLLGTSPSQLWFLLMLFVVFMIFWPLSDFFKNHDIIGLIFVLGLYGISLVGNRFMPNYFNIWNACSFSIYFWIGLKLRQKGSNLLLKIPLLVFILIAVGLFALSKFIISGDSFLITILSIVVNFLLQVIGSITAFLLLQKLANAFSSWKTSKLFGLLTKFSMPMYLFHQQVIYFSLHILNGYVSPYLHVIINFTVSCMLSFLISFILIKFKWTRFLIGEK